MKTEEFNYSLPKSLIAQYPSPERGDSRLMVVHRKEGTIEHTTFHEVSRFLHSGDLLIVNNTRVFPARLIGKKETGGKCEALLIPQWNGNRGAWKALIKGVKNREAAFRISFAPGIDAEVTELRDGKGTIRFLSAEQVETILQKLGHIPLPPYIKREEEAPDRDRYQTIFAEKEGSIAAPTAGLHFTPKIVQSFKGKGVRASSITLHIGPGTFKPVQVEDITNHSMDAEWTEISQETVEEIEQTRETGGRIIAVGTTTTRALESFSDSEGRVRVGQGDASLFITPPYRFRVIDGLITNFHLPKSTLLMLVSAFAGKDLLMRAYQEAVGRGYRFYSYGDAMLIL